MAAIARVAKIPAQSFIDPQTISIPAWLNSPQSSSLVQTPGLGVYAATLVATF